VSTTSTGSTPSRLVRGLRARAAAAARAVRRMRRPQTRALLAAALALALLLAGWFWLRDSSLVQVRTVEVSGVAGAPGTQGARVRAALDDAARSMTTLHVRHDALDTAVAPFSLVKRIEVSTDFPSTMRIHVVTNVAVGAVVVDGRRIAVTSDGTLLRDVAAPKRLPEIPLRAAPGGERLTEPAARTAVAALGAAPEALRTRVKGIVTTPEHGLEIQLAHGPVLWFGSGERLAAKWMAAAAVLADREAAGASSIDVSAPERPAVGGLPGGAPAEGESDIPEPPAGATTEPQPEVEANAADASTLDPQ
jgi:cell division protein FtsQ